MKKTFLSQKFSSLELQQRLRISRQDAEALMTDNSRTLTLRQIQKLFGEHGKSPKQAPLLQPRREYTKRPKSKFRLPPHLRTLSVEVTDASDHKVTIYYQRRQCQFRTIERPLTTEGILGDVFDYAHLWKEKKKSRFYSMFSDALSIAIPDSHKYYLKLQVLFGDDFTDYVNLTKEHRTLKEIYGVDPLTVNPNLTKEGYDSNAVRPFLKYDFRPYTKGEFLQYIKDVCPMYFYKETPFEISYYTAIGELIGITDKESYYLAFCNGKAPIDRPIIISPDVKRMVGYSIFADTIKDVISIEDKSLIVTEEYIMFLSPFPKDEIEERIKYPYFFRNSVNYVGTPYINRHGEIIVTRGMKNYEDLRQIELQSRPNEEGVRDLNEQ